MRSFADQAMRAVHWSVGTSVATLLVQLVITAVIARMLGPADFGLYAIANVAFMIAICANVYGLAATIAREPSLNSDVVGSALLVSLSVSAILACAVMLIAPLASSFGGDTEDSELTRFLMQLTSARILVAGIGTPAQALMQRDLRFRDLGLIQFAGYLIGTGGITIFLARVGFGPQSLIWGDIANSAMVSGICWWSVRRRWSTSWNAAHVLRIVRIGWQMTSLCVLDVLWTQLPLLVAKAYLSASAVGLYQRSQTLVNIGIQNSTARISAVVYPAMAAHQDHRGFLRELIPPLVGLYSMFLFSAAAFVAVMAPDIVQALLGPAWTEAAQTISWIMIAFVALHVSQPASIQMEALALLRPRLISSASGTVGFILFGLILVKPYGLQGIAVAALLSGLTTTSINFVAVAHYLQVKPLDLAGWMIPSTAAAFVLFLILEILYPFVAVYIHSPPIRLVMMTPVAGAIALAGVRLLLGSRRRAVLALYMSPEMPRFANVIARLLGFQLPQREPLKGRLAG